MLQDLGVGDSVLPPDVQQAAKAAEVESTALVWLMLSTTRCHKGESTGHKLGSCTSWSSRSTGQCSTLAC